MVLTLFEELTTLASSLSGWEMMLKQSKFHHKDPGLYHCSRQHVQVVSAALCYVFLFSCMLCPVHCTESSKFYLGLQLPRNISFPFSALRIGSAIQLAIDKINLDPNILPNHTLDFVYADSDCNPKVSIREFIDQVQRYNISALFGPACPDVSEVRDYLYRISCLVINILLSAK